MTYQMVIKDSFIKEWQVYNCFGSYMSRDIVKSVDDAVLRSVCREATRRMILKTVNGSQYNSQEFSSFMDITSITPEYIKKHMPIDNGDVESFLVLIRTDCIGPFEMGIMVKLQL